MRDLITLALAILGGLLLGAALFYDRGFRQGAATIKREKRISFSEGKRLGERSAGFRHREIVTHATIEELLGPGPIVEERS